MGSLVEWFRRRLLDGGNTVTVIGSGGKTSLIWRMAAGLSGAAGPFRRILVTPTTKMFVPEGKPYDRYCGGVPPEPVPGVTLAGFFNEKSGKLESLPPEELERIRHGYDLVLIEGDGARGLPLKAWAEDEPVIPSFTNITVGILPLWPLGKPVTEKIIHRLPLFASLSGAEEGELLKPEHIRRVISGWAGNPGLFARARGSRILFFNQTEDSRALMQARELAEHLPPRFPDAIIAGSVRDNLVTELR